MLRGWVVGLLVSCGSSSPELALGAACFDSSQCASAYCQYPMMASLAPPMCGACAAPGPATGESCTSSCIQGDACVAGTCVPEATANQPCDSSNTTAPHCGPQLFCDSTSHCIAITGDHCGPTPPDGQFVTCPSPKVCTTSEGGNFCALPSGSTTTCH